MDDQWSLSYDHHNTDTQNQLCCSLCSAESEIILLLSLISTAGKDFMHSGGGT